MLYLEYVYQNERLTSKESILVEYVNYDRTHNIPLVESIGGF